MQLVWVLVFCHVLKGNERILNSCSELAAFYWCYIYELDVTCDGGRSQVLGSMLVGHSMILPTFTVQ